MIFQKKVPVVNKLLAKLIFSNWQPACIYRWKVNQVNLIRR